MHLEPIGPPAAASRATQHDYRINYPPLVLGLGAGMLVPTALRYVIPWINPRIAFEIDHLSVWTHVAIHLGAAVLAGGGLVVAALQDRSRNGTIVVDDQGIRQVDSKGLVTWHCSWAWTRVTFSPHRNELVFRKGSQAPLAVPGGSLAGPFLAIHDLSSVRAAVERYADVQVEGNDQDREAGRRGFIYGCIATASVLVHLFATPLLARALGKERYSLYWFLAIIGPWLMLQGGVQWATGRGGLKLKSPSWSPPVTIFAVITAVLIGLSVL